MKRSLKLDLNEETPEMKKPSNRLAEWLVFVSLGVLVTSAVAEEQGGNRLQIDPAALSLMKKTSPKQPLSFALDTNLKMPTARTADGTVVRLLPAQDAVIARRNLQTMLSRPEQQAARKTVALMQSRNRPAVVANLSAQTPTRNQGGRGTCGIFAAVAGLEAALKRQSHRDYDLSEQHVNWLKNVTWMANADQPEQLSQRNAAVVENLPGSLSAGVSCVGILQMLTRYSAVEENANPYIDSAAYEDFATAPFYRNSDLQNYRLGDPNFSQKAINGWNFAAAQMPEAARVYPLYGVREVVALSPEEFRRPEVIESLVAGGKDVVFAITLYAATPTSNPRDPVWRHAPGAAEGGGHCMVIVGYDRNRRFFIVKNSWGNFNYDVAMLDPQWGDVAQYNNYVLLDYDCLSDVYEAGYINSTNAVINFEQRMLGLWDVKIRQKSTNRIVMSGTLAWRQKAPYLSENGASHVQLTQKSYRIGDFTDSENRSYRVNGEIVHVQKLRLYIAFDHPNMPYTDRGGIKIEGRWKGRDSGRQTIEAGTLMPTGIGSELGTALGIHNLNGVPLPDLEFSAVLR